jgi:hypothetical protein
MNRRSDDLACIQNEYDRLNNELVVPSYRAFCKAYRLSFHFWDELPEDEFDRDISERELALHKDAMSLFNRLKPEVQVFEGHAVQYRFTCWDGSFEYERAPLDKFAESVGDQLFYLRHLERRFRVVCSVLSAIVFILGAFLCTFGLVHIFGQRTVWLQQVISIGLPALLGGSVLWWTGRTPRGVLDDIHLRPLAKQMLALRKKLATA